MINCPVPEAFIDPEDDAELQYHGLPIYETTDSTLRQLWQPWLGGDNGGWFVPGQLFGRPIGTIPQPAVPAYEAFDRALRSAGYVARASWSFNHRTIAGSGTPSLHAYGIAVDLDPTLNPYGVGDPYSGAIKRAHVEAVLAIKNRDGASIWSWGGNWRKPDRMHFQLDQGPDRVEVDWSTVPGWRPAGDQREQAPGSGERGEVVTPEAGAGPGTRVRRSATDRSGWSTGPAHRRRLSAGG